MDSWYIPASTFACVFGSALLGCVIRRRVGEHRLTPALHETFRLTAGVVATMTALVLGLLIGSTKSTYDAKLNDVRDFVFNAYELDRAMRPDELHLSSERQKLADIMKAATTRIWDTKQSSAGPSADVLAQLDQIREKIRGLQSQSELERAQRQHLLALSDALLVAGYQLLVKDNTSIPLLLFAGVDIWLSMIFLGFGLFSEANLLSVNVLLVGALSLSIGFFVIVEMNEAFTGWISIPRSLMEGLLFRIDQLD